MKKQRFFSRSRFNRRSNPSKLGLRKPRLAFEPLENRWLLSTVGLNPISNLTMSAGTAVYIPLNATDPGQTVNYAVAASDYSKLTPVITPQTNKTLQMSVEINGTTETMTFRLFDDLAPTTTAAIEALVNSSFYNTGATIYRNAKPEISGLSVIQGGKTDDTVSSIAEEFNPDLQFTSAGILAMARQGDPSTSSTEFFITEDATSRVLDYNYTIFGIQISGSDVVSTISAMPNQTGSEDLVNPVDITSASIIADTQDGVLELRAPSGVTGTVTVTVTASDGTNTPTTQSFTVTIQADSSSNPANPFTAVTPAAPSSVTFLPPGGASGQYTNLNNSDGSHTLQFQVSGVTSGNLVEVLADGNVIGQAIASDTSVVVPTDGSTEVTDGLHQITAIQIAQNQTVTVDESNASGGTTPTSQTADVPSFESPASQLTVDTVVPQFDFTPVTAAVVGVPYTCQVKTDPDSSGAVTYQLSQPPAGMTINSDTGLITWTPTADQTPTEQVTVQATDPAGNTSQQQFTINVLATNSAPVLTAANPSLGTTDEDTAITISLAQFINGSGTTTITDADQGAVIGGLALTGVTGNGTWQYSLDGTTFTDVGTVSENSALLLASNVELRYTPDGKNGETATITYCAWDTTGGANGVPDDLTVSGVVGGSGPFSTATDTASLTVTSLNDAPVLTPASPSLGMATSNSPITISLATFINNGSGTTTITDVDSGAVVGGIALIGTTGNGTWAYSLDGTSFTAVGTVTGESALLLPSNASLQYTPATTDAQTATITYRAWDTTAGQSGTKIDTTTNDGTTAFSTATDTASLTLASGSLSGYVYLDVNNNGQMDSTESGLAGVSVKLTDGGGSILWTQTNSAGYYNFQGLAAETYQVQVIPSSKLLVSQDTLQVSLGATENSSGHDFAVEGLQPSLISLRLFLASTPPMTQVIQDMHTAPTVSLNTGGATYNTGASPVVVASSASISSPDSATLVSMTVSIENLLDGSSEQLQATTSGTPLTSTYANGVLTISGVADVATYQTLLESITYSNSASAPTIATRTISVVVNDGTVASPVATTTLTVQQTAATTTSVASSANPSAYGDSVSFTATVASSSGSGTPTGTVTFMDGDTTLGTGTLTDGTASFTIATLTAGDHSITAVYGGDTSFVASTSVALTQTVEQAATTTSVASSANPSAYGDSLILTATVDFSSGSGTPTGTVTFMDGDTTLGTGTLTSGTASLTTSALAVGDHSITAVYGGDTNFTSSTSGAVTQTVEQAATTSSVASSENPSAYGDSVSFTATVTSSPGGGTPTGTVTFMDGDTTLGTGTLTDGTASFTTSALALGDHSITAVYGGDTNFTSSTSDTLTQTVKQASATSVTSSANPSAYGDSVSFTATVTSSSGSGTPTGTVTFMDGDTTLGTGTLTDGTASFTIATLTAGDHSITAVYGGDTSFVASTSVALTQTVEQAATTTSVASSANPSAYGDSLILTATVDFSSGSGTPTGTVTFMDGDTTLGTGTLTSGTASLTTSALAVGDHSITAVYGGDTNFTSSTSGAVTQTVEQAATTSSVASSENPSAYGDSVSFTATVTSSPGGGTPTGTVTFMDGDTTLGTGTLTDGTASFTTSALALGDHSITAVYGGDTNFTSSTSDTLTQTVKQASATSVASSANPSAYGDSVSFTATVTSSSGSGTPTGTVTFMDGDTTLGTGTLTDGTASFTIATLTAGDHSITAVYGGDTSFVASTSVALTQTVEQAATTTSVASSANPSAYGDSLILTATVDFSSGSGTPTGTVTFMDGDTTLGTGTLTSGTASLTTSALAVGDHSITAVYGGDTNFTTSTSDTLTQTIA